MRKVKIPQTSVGGKSWGDHKGLQEELIAKEYPFDYLIVVEDYDIDEDGDRCVMFDPSFKGELNHNLVNIDDLEEY